jgi:ATP-dependent RNA helicase DDX55/SPB4
LPIFIQQHKDVVVEAITGSGKTLAFVIPIIEILLKRNNGVEKLKKNQIGALIITPTRELGKQIFDVLNVFLEAMNYGLKSILFVGGNGVAEDVKKLETDGANIVIATVGRLEDLLTRQNSSLTLKKYLKSLVG